MQSKWIFRMVLVLTLTVGVSAAATAVSSRPASRPAATQPADTVPPEVDAILTRLEKAGDTIKDLQANIANEIYQAIPDDRQVKLGILRYRAARGGQAGKFMVVFDTLIHEDLKLKQKQWICFNGRWLREITEQTRTAIDREVVAPDEKIDPYKLGEGFFPLPFGQKKSEILANFNVTLVKPEKTDPAGSDHLVLVPKPDSRFSKRYEKIEFWIDAKTSLPARIVSRDKHAVITTVNFQETRANIGIPDADLWVDVPAGYAYQREPLAGPE